MNQSEKILVIILSVTLLILIVLCILVAIKTLQILNRIKAITEKTEGIATKAESIGNIIQKSAETIVFSRILNNFADNTLKLWSKKNNSRRNRDEK